MDGWLVEHTLHARYPRFAIAGPAEVRRGTAAMPQQRSSWFLPLLQKPQQHNTERLLLYVSLCWVCCC